MRGQDQGRALVSERDEVLQRRFRLPLVGRDAVDEARPQVRFRVGRIAREQDAPALGFEDDRDMIWRVAGRRDRANRAIAGEALRLRERPKREGVEPQRLGREIARPTLRQIAGELAAQALGGGKLAGRDQDVGLAEIGEPAVVIDVQMGENDGLHVGGADAERLQPRPDFLFAVDVELHGEAEIGMPAGPQQACVGARVDDHDPVGMLDGVSQYRQPFRPLAVEQRPQPAAKTVTDADRLRAFDADPAAFQGVHAHRRQAPDAAEMGVAESRGVFEPIAQRAIETDMREPNQRNGESARRGEGGGRGRPAPAPGPSNARAL